MPERKLDRTHNRRAIVRALAAGTKPAHIADHYNVHRSSITRFIERHHREIHEAKHDLENEYAGLWIADKSARLAELQDDIEYCNALIDPALQDLIDEATENEDPEQAAALARDAARSAIGDPNVLRIKAAALKQAAEELGQLTTKAEIEHTVAYQVTTVDPGQLT